MKMKNTDFENLEYNEFFGYEGEISINFFGKNVNVYFTVNVGDEEIADMQYETYEKFKECWLEINTMDGIIILKSFIIDDVYLTFNKKYGNDTEYKGIGVRIVNEEMKYLKSVLKSKSNYCIICKN